MYFHFLSVYFLLFFSPSCTSFYALCSSVVSCLSQGSFSNKFHKTWFRVRKDLQCIVLKQGTVIWAHTLAPFCHIMTLIFSALSPWPQSSLCCHISIANTKTFNNHPSRCFVTHVQEQKLLFCVQFEGPCGDVCDKYCLLECYVLQSGRYFCYIIQHHTAEGSSR